MQLTPLCDLEMRYTQLDSLDYEAGGQLFGTMEGTVQGERLRGSVRLVNLAPRRADNVNMPTLRGLLTLEDAATAYITMDGLALLRPSDNARVFVTSVTFRTGDARHMWLNTTFGLREGVLDTVGQGGTARGRIYHCEATIAPATGT